MRKAVQPCTLKTSPGIGSSLDGFVIVISFRLDPPKAYQTSFDKANGWRRSEKQLDSGILAALYSRVHKSKGTIARHLVRDTPAEAERAAKQAFDSCAWRQLLKSFA
jgi:hypothetical protein